MCILFEWKATLTHKSGSTSNEQSHDVTRNIHRTAAWRLAVLLASEHLCVIWVGGILFLCFFLLGSRNFHNHSLTWKRDENEIQEGPPRKCLTAMNELEKE